MIRFERIAVLGATGPTGKFLAREWVDRGVSVRVVSRSEKNLEREFRGLAIERVAADMLDREAAERAVRGCDVAFDCIGLPMDRIADHPPTARNIAAAAAAANARLVHVSSYWAYLPIARLPLTEEHPRVDGSLPVRMRREAEDVLQRAGAAVVNLPDFYGPEAHLSVLNRALEEAVQGRTVNWIGSAHTAREHVYVPDAMKAVVGLSQREEAYGERWIVPGAGPVSLRDVEKIAAEHLGRPIRTRTAGSFVLKALGLFSSDLRALSPLIPAYVSPIRYDGSKLLRLLGDIPVTPYERAIPITLDWLAAKNPPG